MDVLAHTLAPGDNPPDIRVPYLASYALDYGTFEDFPKRKRFSMHEQHGRLELILSTDHTYAEYTDLLQSWLFFALIHMVHDRFGLPVDLGEFMRSPVDGEPQITAAILRKSFWPEDRRRRKAQLNARAGSPAGSRSLCQDIDLAHHHVNLFDFADIDGSSTPGDRALRSQHRGSVTLSIKYLLHQFVNMVHLKSQCRISDLFLGPGDTSRLYQESETRRLLCADERENASPSAGIMQKYLETNGWCPVLARDLLCRQPLAHVYFAAATIRHDKNYAAHDQCSDSEGCVASNLDLDDFEPKHIENRCCCKPVKPDIGKIYDILQRDQIPVARLSRDKTNRTVLEMVAASPDWKYTAISHVWADGLANAKYNGVFQCQLDKIFDCVWRMQIEYKITSLKVNGHYDPPVTKRRASVEKLLLRAISSKQLAIWVDAICVPVPDPDDLVRSGAMKMRAINLMTPTYAGASNVLVLDHSVEQLSKREVFTPSSWAPWRYQCGHEERHVSVMRHCSWMGRCWTLQEGALARNLFFRCSGWAFPAPHFVLSEVNPTDTQKLIEDLLSRSTSMKADLDQILANLSMLDASELTQYPPSDRVKAFLLARANPFSIGLLLRRLERVPDKPRKDWWIPDLQSRASFFSIGWQSTDIATPYDCGVLIRGHGRAFWQEDMSNIEPCSIRPTGNVGKTFWLMKDGELFWVALDLGVECFAGPATETGSPALVLLLPGKSFCKNACGFTGRGLCLTSIGKKQTYITVCDAEKKNKAWSTLYNCAFSMGIKTPVSAVKYADAPVLYAQKVYEDSDEDRSFFIESDTVSWPQLRTIRSVKNSWLKSKIVPGALDFLAIGLWSVLLGAFITLFATVPCYVETNCNEARLALLMLPVICSSFGVISLTRTMVVRRRNLRSRQSAFKEWVQSFSANSQQRSSNAQPQA